MTLKTPVYMQAKTGDTEISYSAEDFRSLFHGIFRVGGVLRPDTVAGGLKVSQKSTGADMSVDVAAGRAIIEGDDATDQGKYFCWSTDVTNVTVPDAPASGTRTHLIYAQVQDPVHNADWTDYQWVIDLLEDTGTGLPDTPASAIPLASVEVASTDTSVEDAAITDLRFNTRLTGSQVPQVFSDSARPPVPYVSEQTWRTDNGNLEIHDGTDWREIPRRDGGGTEWTTYTPQLTATTTNPGMGSTALRQGRYIREGRRVTVEVILEFAGTNLTAGSGTYEVSLPVTARTQSTGRRTGPAYAWDDSASNMADGIVYIDESATTKVRFCIDSNVVTAAAPWTWADGDQLGFTLTYEAAS